MRLNRLLCTSALALALGAFASANSITTIYGSNNGGDFGGMVYFDLTVGANAITVTGFDVNTSLDGGGSFGFTVFTTPTGYSGNEGNAGAWTQVSTGTGAGQGEDNASAVSLANSFTLNANTTYGIALQMGPEATHEYTDGNGSNQNYSNADLALSFGAASNSPFDGSPFSPRVWNGSIYYDVAPVPEPASLAALGLGALALVRRRRSKKA